MSLNIFILEDDPNFRQILELRLKAWKNDAHCVFAENLAEAQKILAGDALEFDLAICDHELPDGVGERIVEHPKLKNTAVLSVSSIKSAELPGLTLQAGAQHFLSKRQVSEPFFIPLLEALITRRKLEVAEIRSNIQKSKIETIGMMLATLRHEINNPLGAVIGGTYLVRAIGNLDAKQEEALKLIDESGQRIKHVIEKLCDAVELEIVSKANEKVFHVPGDKPWE